MSCLLMRLLFYLILSRYVTTSCISGLPCIWY